MLAGMMTRHLAYVVWGAYHEHDRKWATLCHHDLTVPRSESRKPLARAAKIIIGHKVYIFRR